MFLFKKNVLVKILATSLIFVFLFSNFTLAGKPKRIKDDVILEMVERALKNYPEKIKKLPIKIQKVIIFALKVDKKQVSQPLFKQIQGKLESMIRNSEAPTLLYAPEIKLFKIISKGDSIQFKSNFQTTKEIQEVSKQLNIDGFMEGDLYITESNHMYINLRIFDVETMAVVWSEQFSTLEKVIKRQEFGMDLGLGIAGLQVAKTDNTKATLEIPNYTEYYTVDLRILQRAYLESKINLTLSGGLLPLVKGIESNTKSLVSGSTLLNYYGRLGLRISLFPIKPKEEDMEEMFLRDWLAMEFSYGKLFSTGIKNLDMIGLRFESNITKNVSIAAGLSYVPYTVVPLGGDGDVKIGGFLYELSLLRINLMF